MNHELHEYQRNAIKQGFFFYCQQTLNLQFVIEEKKEYTNKLSQNDEQETIYILDQSCGLTPD